MRLSRIKGSQTSALSLWCTRTSQREVKKWDCNSDLRFQPYRRLVILRKHYTTELNLNFVHPNSFSSGSSPWTSLLWASKSNWAGERKGMETCGKGDRFQTQLYSQGGCNIAPKVSLYHLSRTEALETAQHARKRFQNVPQPLRLPFS